MITRKELINEYIEFFKEKGHQEIPSASLVPENDPTVLFTTAGMHPLVPYLLGEKHPLGKRIVDVQKCIRTGDIEEVGDTTHHTFFEMLGNWSMGDYFKKEAIEWSFEFLTKVLNIPIERLAVSVFGGDNRESKVPIDNEATQIWKNIGIPKERIALIKGGIYESENNWWGPAGTTGPCGPDTEMFYWKLNNIPAPRIFNPEDNNWVEIWNDVLMQYNKDSKGNYNKAQQKNIDTGMGVERTVAILNKLEDNYLTSMWKPIIEEIEKLSNKKYKNYQKEMRIIADHIKASVFIISDGVTPSNTLRGYVLRRLIRRAIRLSKKIGIEKKQDLITPIVEKIINIYSDTYQELKINKQKIIEELNNEAEKFENTLDNGLKEFQKMIDKDNQITAKDAFLLFQSYGFPIEMTSELANEKGVKIDIEGFNNELKKHQELSKTLSAGTFKSGLADNSIATTKLHTAAHLLLAAIRMELKNDSIMQKGSNITSERLRLDFNFDRKLTKEELERIEDRVNAEIQKSCEVIREEMSPEEAFKQGAIGAFEHKYGSCITVYRIDGFSKEICAGPHVKNTCELGKFKIQKEEASSSGIRRIKAILK